MIELVRIKIEKLITLKIHTIDAICDVIDGAMTSNNLGKSE